MTNIDQASLADYLKKGLHFALKWQWPAQHRETLLVIARTEVSIIIDHCSLKLESAVVARCSNAKSIMQRVLMQELEKEDIEYMERTFDELASACVSVPLVSIHCDSRGSSILFFIGSIKRYCRRLGNNDCLYIQNGRKFQFYRKNATHWTDRAIYWLGTPSRMISSCIQ